jgi:DNA-binding transcriptional regulator YbjK
VPRTAERRQIPKDALISAAERTIETHGVSGLKARALAFKVGCAVVYNVVNDLDDLIFAVNSCTLAALAATLRRATGFPLWRMGRPPSAGW